MGSSPGRTATLAPRADGGRPSAAGLPARTSADSILLGVTVDLFRDNGVALAPLGVSPVGTQQRYHENAGVIGFDGPNFSGTLTLSLPNATLEALARAQAPEQPCCVEDWLRELTNQLLGRFKNRLAVFQMPLRMHLPSALSATALERLRRPSPSQRLYQFRSTRSSVLVTCDAPIDDALLVYSNAVEVAKEGTVILF